MTNERIDVMEAGRELDALIAECVFGKPSLCRLIGDGIKEPLRLDEPDAVWRERSPADSYWERFSPYGAERVINDFAVLRYSTDIAAAWQVWEKIGQPTISKSNPRGQIMVWVTEDQMGPLEVAEAETAPLAICRAALKTVAAESPPLSAEKRAVIDAALDKLDGME